MQSEPRCQESKVPALYEVTFDGNVLRRGFWLYVWEITQADGSPIYYIGRTGDSSSTKAQSPFHRMGQHLGFAVKSNRLRRLLEQLGIKPEELIFRIVALGPLEPESMAASRHEHDLRRDLVAAMEKALADLFVAADCRVLNSSGSRRTLDSARFEEVRRTFAAAFPLLTEKPKGVFSGASR